jgi:hypothetical protein
VTEKRGVAAWRGSVDRAATATYAGDEAAGGVRQRRFRDLSEVNGVRREESLQPMEIAP